MRTVPVILARLLSGTSLTVYPYTYAIFSVEMGASAYGVLNF